MQRDGQPIMGRALFVVWALAALTAPQVNAAVISVDFEDATGHDDPIPGNQYAGLSISNGVWIQAAFPFGTFGEGSFGLGVENGVQPVNNWAFPGTTSPIVITFDDLALASQLSIRAFDVGVNGAFIEAFDTLGTSLGSDSAVGAGLGNGNAPVLSISAPGIKTVHLRQIQVSSSIDDGLGWDNLSAVVQEVQSVPEPSSLALLGIAGLTMCGYRRRRKD